MACKDRMKLISPYRACHPILGMSTLSSVRLRGGATKPKSSGDPKFKKTFSLGSCLQDHLTIMNSIPSILDAYAGPNRIDPAAIEGIMLAVNSVNECPYCTALHGELARMAGVNQNVAKDTKKPSPEEVEEDAMFCFARIFGQENGRGACVAKKYQELEKSVGKGKAASVRALCWFLHWGSISGNTIISFYRLRLSGSPKPGSNILFEILFATYYTPLYLVISATTVLLKAFPARVPKAMSKAIGCILAPVAAVWIVPIGLLGLLTAPLRRSTIALR
jgi:AhpD family alkylhydroperoxidase